MITPLKKMLNRFRSTSKRPQRDSIEIFDNHTKFGKYLTYYSINSILLLVNFFIQELIFSGIKPNKRLLSLTELSLDELNDIKDTITKQTFDCKIILNQKDIFVKMTHEQRQNLYCLVTDYEIIMVKYLNNSNYQDEKSLIDAYKMASLIRNELNTMFEIKEH